MPPILIVTPRLSAGFKYDTFSYRKGKCRQVNRQRLERAPRASRPAAVPRGRPRDRDVDQRIVQAALGLLAAEGFDGMSIERVADAAGVPKPTVYRRFKGKADLATAALACLQAREPSPRGETAQERVRAILAAFREGLLRPNGMAMIGTLLVEERRHPELLALFRERIVTPRRRLLCEALARGVETGELRADVDLDAAVNLLVGSFYARYLTGDPIPASWPSRVVSTLWPGLAR